MTIRVHNYQERHGMSVCEDCGMVENKYAYGPRWCAGRLPSIEQREPVEPRDNTIEVAYRGGYLQDETGDRWWSQGFVAHLEKRIEAMRAYQEQLAAKVAEQAGQLAAAQAELTLCRESLREEREGVRDAVKQARREGAEAMREKCYSAVSDDYYWKDITAIRIDDDCDTKVCPHDCVCRACVRARKTSDWEAPGENAVTVGDLIGLRRV